MMGGLDGGRLLQDECWSEPSQLLVRQGQDLRDRGRGSVLKAFVVQPCLMEEGVRDEWQKREDS